MVKSRFYGIIVRGASYIASGGWPGVVDLLPNLFEKSRHVTSNQVGYPENVG